MYRTISVTILAGLLIAVGFMFTGCGGGINPADISNDWALVWGGTSYDNGSAVITDESGNIYVAGVFSDETDFNPVPERVASLSVRYFDKDFFLTKFSPTGEYQWSRIWGTPEDNAMDENSVNDMTSDPAGNIYVAGYFQAVLDFDPGEAVEEHSSLGQSDAFLSKFDSDGNFIRVLTWGGTSYDSILGVESDSVGNIYVTGNFGETIDFDSGDGVEEHSSNGDADVFVAKLDAEGNFIWACTWGGDTSEYSSAIALDSSGHVLVSGSFHSETVDFDPGLGIDEHQTFAGYDAFLTKLTSDGKYVWTKTWGSYEDDSGTDVDVDGSGNVYIAGGFKDPMDVNPGAGVKMLYSNGYDDVYLVKFSPVGDYQWGFSWGGVEYDVIGGIEVNGGNIYIAGSFRGDVDFDPGSAMQSLDSYYDICVSCFNPDGLLRWVGRWETPDEDYCSGITVSNAGHIFISGYTTQPPPSDESAFLYLPEYDAFLVRFSPYYGSSAMPF